MKRFDLEKGAGLVLDRSSIPLTLHHCIPFIEKWAFESHEDQDDFVAEMERTRPLEVLEFNQIIDQNVGNIREWRITLTQLNKQVCDLTDHDMQHPYWDFLRAIKIRELT